jgi:starvation-inducible DNA-binding protein
MNTQSWRISDPTIGPAAVPVTPADAESCPTVAVLEELLTQSIHMRDLYCNARWQCSGIQAPGLRQMLHDHYKEQLTLIDVLLDRIRNLGGAARIFAGDFLKGIWSCHVLRSPRAADRLLRELLDAHESVLSIASPNDSSVDHHWVRDFAVGKVMLTNDIQKWSVNEQLRGHDPQQRFLQTDAIREQGCE